MPDSVLPPAAARTLISLNPADESVLGEVPLASPEDVARAVAAARRAQGSWQALGFRGRARHLLRLRDELKTSRRAVADAICQENGKPYGDAMAEVFSACDFLAHYAHQAGKILADEPIRVRNPLLRNHRTYLTYQPKGIVGVISPWNYPLLLSMASISGALAAGNTVIHKPSEWTPLVALQLEGVARRAGMPPGVLEVLPGDGSTGAALVDAAIDHVCFTGSVPTGKRVAARCAERLRTVTLELGGKDPALVLAPFDLEFTAQGVVWAAFTNSGQACASIERLYLPRREAAPLIARIVQLVEGLTVAPGWEARAQVGPIINRLQLEKIEAQVRDAVDKGAKLLTGGRILPGPGYWYAPTVLTGVTPDMALMQEETFGPVLPLIEVDDVEDMIRLANDSRFGLSATVWSQDLRRAEQVGRRLQAGTVWVNTGLDSYGNPATPRGGVKESGLGRVGGKLGLYELVEPRLIDVNRSGRFRLTWHVGREGYREFMEGGLLAMHGGSLGERLRGSLGVLRHWLPRIL